MSAVVDHEEPIRLADRTGGYRNLYTVDPRDNTKHNDVTGQFHPHVEFKMSMKLIGTKHPHIFKKIYKDWGTQKLQDYLTFIMNVDTEGRQGFPFDSANALMTIILEHSSKFDLTAAPETQLKRTFRRDSW